MAYKFRDTEIVKIVNRDRLEEIYEEEATISSFSQDEDGKNVYIIMLNSGICWYAREEELETTGKFSKEKIYDGSSIRVSGKGEILSTNIIDPKD